MDRINFRHRNSTGRVEAPQELDEHAELPSHLERLSVAKPRFQQTISAESVSQTAFPQTRQSRIGRQVRGYASPADSILPTRENQIVDSSRGQTSHLLGLHLLCDHIEPEGDIIFVHGLGGSAVGTWCWKREISRFWPMWLVEDQELTKFRIFSFGYDSDFKGAGSNLTTMDFAKGLLFSMLTFSGGLIEGANEWIPIGSRPIIFVAHSMGGLVIKKAHILGKHDKIYSELIAQVYGMVFLATPHRGAHYTKMLNNILSACPIGTSSKAYVAELDIHSGSLQDINEQFRVSCENLSLASFCETRKTFVGIAKIMIVEKESGILGYSNEASLPLNADHYSICKFKTRQDSNYIHVKSLLKHWSRRLRVTSRPERLASECNSNVDINHLQTILAIRESPAMDLDFLRSRVLEGTCLWITTKQEFIAWVEPSGSRNPNLFWLVGLPATGKTCLAKSVIDHLQFLGHDCFYHFFSSDHQEKRTATYCLWSLAFQIACKNEEFREKLCNLVKDSGTEFNSQTFELIWEKVFQGILFKLTIRTPIFLILDGINEADSQLPLITQLFNIRSEVPVKVFLTSHPMRIPSPSTRSLSLLTIFALHEEDTKDDICTYVQNVVRNALPDDPKFQEDISNQVRAKASGLFLWVKLVLDTLQHNWHTKEDIQKALTEVPTGMTPFYKRMLDKVKAQSPRLQLMAKRILTWAICCWRPLTVAELQVALQPEFGDFVQLEHTIIQICGHFITVDNSKISVVHDTARSFLLHGTDNETPFINPCEGHEHLAMVSLKYLSNDHWRLEFKDIEMSTTRLETKSRPNRLLLAEKNYPLLRYATYYWAYHVSKSSAGSQELMSILKAFLAKHILSWIEGIALSGELRYLASSAWYLKAYAKKKPRNSNLDAQGDLASLQETPKEHPPRLQSWANDFIHIVGKFGRNLVQRPSSVYHLIPPLCPRLSMISATYGFSDDKSLSIAGLASEAWGDRLASVTVGEDGAASKVLATDAYFLTLTSTTGTVVVWHAEIVEEARRIHHSEYVPMMALNRSGTRLTTAGISTYRIWDISTGRELYRLTKPSGGLTMAIAFGSTDSQLLVGLDDCSVTRYDIESSSTVSRFKVRDSLHELRGCPSLMAISPDSRKVAIAWRGKPLLIWDMTKPFPPQECRASRSSNALNAPDLVKWQSDGKSILICLNSTVVEWDLYREEQIRHGKYHDISAKEMTVSADGNFLLTSDHVGTMSVWTFPSLKLIYRLLNGNELIRDLAFSPNGQRFYDIRESMCNIWEPDALMRPDERDPEDISSKTESYVTTEAVIWHDETSRNQVTAFAVGPDDQYHCCGKQDGSVIIYESTGGEKLRKVCHHTANRRVLLLAWSQSGQYIVSSDDSARVISKQLELKERGKWAVSPGIDIRISEAIKQFVFSHDENLLLISSASKDIVWDLKGKREVCAQHHQKRADGRWIADHMNPEKLLWLECEKVCSYTWETLESSETDSSPASAILNSPSGTRARIGSIALSTDMRSLIYETLPRNSVGGPHLSILSTSPLSSSREVDHLSGQVKRFIGTFQNSIVFLDHDYWICTWELEARSSDVKRHFFLPKDWFNASTLQMATLNKEGTLFCPKFGDVIILRNGIKL